MAYHPRGTFQTNSITMKPRWGFLGLPFGPRGTVWLGAPRAARGVPPARPPPAPHGQRAGRADDDLALRPDHGEADRSGGHHRVAAACRRGWFDRQADLRRVLLHVGRPRLLLLDDLAVVVPLPERILDLLHRRPDDLVEETLHAAGELRFLRLRRLLALGRVRPLPVEFVHGRLERGLHLVLHHGVLRERDMCTIGGDPFQARSTRSTSFGSGARAPRVSPLLVLARCFSDASPGRGGISPPGPGRRSQPPCRAPWGDACRGALRQYVPRRPRSAPSPAGSPGSGRTRRRRSSSSPRDRWHGSGHRVQPGGDLTSANGRLM